MGRLVSSDKPACRIAKTGFPNATKVKAAFASSSVIDRIAFARWTRGNRTALMPSREKESKACQQQLLGYFLQSGLPVSIAKLRPFPVFLSGIYAVFSAVQTVWRRGRDSNPRYPFGYAGFQDRCHQPLGHLSGCFSFTTVSILR